VYLINFEIKADIFIYVLKSNTCFTHIFKKWLDELRIEALFYLSDQLQIVKDSLQLELDSACVEYKRLTYSAVQKTNFLTGRQITNFPPVQDTKVGFLTVLITLFYKNNFIRTRGSFLLNI